MIESSARQLIVADVGNTSTQIGLLAGETLIADWRISSYLSRTSDEIAHLVRSFVVEAGHALEPIEGAVVCSVVPTWTENVARALELLVGGRTLVVDSTLDLGLDNLYLDPSAVGPDRLVNAISARAYHGVPAIVVDLGTATTFDAIDERGAYVGGAIAPGLRTAADVLFQRASRLPRVELAVPSQAIGRTTSESIQSGIVRGAGILVDGLVREIKAELGGEARVIATGGDAPLIAGLAQTIDVIDQTLTLRGLVLVDARLRSAADLGSGGER